jgi:hypothetical protein
MGSLADDKWMIVARQRKSHMSLQIVNIAENGLLAVPEKRETCVTLLSIEASYFVHGYVAYLSC